MRFPSARAYGFDMMKQRPSAWAACLLLLGACGQGESPANNSVTVQLPPAGAPVAPESRYTSIEPASCKPIDDSNPTLRRFRGYALEISRQEVRSSRPMDAGPRSTCRRWERKAPRSSAPKQSGEARLRTSDRADRPNSQRSRRCAAPISCLRGCGGRAATPPEREGARDRRRQVAGLHAALTLKRPAASRSLRRCCAARPSPARGR